MSDMTSPSPARRRSCSPRLFGFLFFLLVAIILLTSDKGQISGDGIKRWEALHHLMQEGEWTADKYSIIQPLFAVPVYGVAKLVAAGRGAAAEDQSDIIQNAVQRFNKGIAFATALWLYLLLRLKANAECKQAALAVLLLLFGSLLIPHTKDFYSEPLWTLLCIIAVTIICRIGDRHLSAAGWRNSLLLVFAVSLTIPLNPLLVVVFGLLMVQLVLWRVCQQPDLFRRHPVQQILRSDVLLLGISLVLGVILCLSENMTRRGAFLNFGYPGEGFSTPFLWGFSGQLVSPSRGIVFFIPTFLLGFLIPFRLRGRLPPFLHRMVIVSLAFGTTLLLAYSKWHAWHGAWYWGPRFLLPLSVFGCFYLALFALYREKASFRHLMLVSFTVVLSYMIYKVGVGIGQDPLVTCLEFTPDQERCYWDWSFLPFASWLNPQHLLQMLTDRSTAVEIIGGGLAVVLLRFAPATPSA